MLRLLLLCGSRPVDFVLLGPSYSALDPLDGSCFQRTWLEKRYNVKVARDNTAIRHFKT